jgi:oxalate decarboxylase/phosphoglucose isomerase-like protein (cupin superfamily)
VTDQVEAYVLKEEGDERGRAWQIGKGVDFLSAIEDIHLLTLNPGCVRGNHFHRDKREILIVEHDEEWVLLWDDGLEGEPQERRFEKAGVVTVLVPPGCAHAVENRGGGLMRIVAISDRRYDRSAPDTHRRVLRQVE